MPAFNENRPGPEVRTKIQLALQGGGARFVDLMAVLSAVQRLENKLEVTQIAGSSAGALAAAFYAAGFNLEELWHRLSKDQALHRILLRIKEPTKLQLLWCALTKGPIHSPKPLHDYVDRLLQERNAQTLGSMERNLHLVYTNLQSRTKSSYNKATTPDKNTAAAILDSCGLPFIFKSWGNSADAELKVDGGICENLPVDELMADKSLGKTIAVTFRADSAGVSPTNLAGFAISLIDASISHGVARSRSKVEPADVHEIASSLTLFDFTRAISPEYWPHFELIRYKAEAHLDSWLISEKLRPRNQAVYELAKKEPHVRMLLEENHRLYTTVFAKRSVKTTAVEMEAVSRQPYSRADEQDLMRIIEVFTPNEPIPSLWFDIEYNEHYISDNHSCIVTQTATGLEVKNYVRLPTMNPRSSSRGFLVVFESPLAAGQEYKVDICERGKNLLHPYHSTGKDELGYLIKNPNHIVCSLSFTLIYKQRPQPITLSPRNDSVVQPTPISEAAANARAQVHGSDMAGTGVVFSLPTRQPNQVKETLFSVDIV